MHEGAGAADNLSCPTPTYKGWRGRPTSPATPAPHGTHWGVTRVADEPSHPAPSRPHADAMGNRRTRIPARDPGRPTSPATRRECGPPQGTPEGRARGGRQAQPHPRHWVPRDKAQGEPTSPATLRLHVAGAADEPSRPAPSQGERGGRRAQQPPRLMAPTGGTRGWPTSPATPSPNIPMQLPRAIAQGGPRAGPRAADEPSHPERMRPPTGNTRRGGRGGADKPSHARAAGHTRQGPR